MKVEQLNNSCGWIVLGYFVDLRPSNSGQAYSLHPRTGLLEILIFDDARWTNRGSGERMSFFHHTQRERFIHLPGESLNAFNACVACACSSMPTSTKDEVERVAFTPLDILAPCGPCVLCRSCSDCACRPSEISFFIIGVMPESWSLASVSLRTAASTVADRLCCFDCDDVLLWLPREGYRHWEWKPCKFERSQSNRICKMCAKTSKFERSLNHKRCKIERTQENQKRVKRERCQKAKICENWKGWDPLCPWGGGPIGQLLFL